MDTELIKEFEYIKERLARVESALERRDILKPIKKIIQKPENPKVEHAELTWTYMPGISSWNVFASYRCPVCDKDHDANIIIHANTSNGKWHEVVTKCGKQVDILLQKKEE